MKANKKIIKKVIFGLGVLSAVTLMSCQSTKNTGYDTYDYDSENTDAQKISSGSTQSDKKFNFAEMFFGKKFIEVDESTLSTPTATFGIKQKPAQLVYSTKTNWVGFGSSYLAAYYYVTFEDKARASYIKAVESYLDDFENKRLNRKDRKSTKAYGSGNIRLDWGTIKSSTPNNGTGPAQFGYVFKDGSPYFCITIYPVGNTKRLNGDDMAEPESMMLSYYFTKAQAKQLAAFLSDENVASLFSDIPVDEELLEESDEY